MTVGFKRLALVAYLLLTAYLLGQRVPDDLMKNAGSLDACLAKVPPAGAAPALASALDLDPAGVMTRMRQQEIKPSTLAIASFVSRKTIRPLQMVLKQTEIKTEPAAYVARRGLDPQEVSHYLKEVQKSVESHLSAKPVTQVTSF